MGVLKVVSFTGFRAQKLMEREEGRDASRFHRVEPTVSRMFAALYLVALLYVIFAVLQFCGTTMGGFPPRPLAAKMRASNFAFCFPSCKKVASNR